MPDDVQLGLNDVFEARRRMRGVAIETPLAPSSLGADRGADILLKLESVQPIGAFKIRGAANALMRLSPKACARGVVCASSGNHGRAVAHVAARLGLRAVVCLSTATPAVKVAAIEALGAEVRQLGATQDESQREVDRLVADEGMTEISPFDHPDVIAGQGVIALELFEARPDLSAIVAPLSGGGLAGGIALAAKAIAPHVRVIGVSMDHGAAMADSIAAGRLVAVEERPSLADALVGGLGESNRWSFDLCRRLLDETVLVSEQEIYRAMRALFLQDRLVAEGGAAVGAAALLSSKLALDGPTAIVLSGRNVDMTVFRAIIESRPVRLGDREVEG